jgi:hypothetical protein
MLPCETHNLEELTAELLYVRGEMMRLSAEHPGILRKVLPAHLKSACNLTHFLAFRL